MLKIDVKTGAFLVVIGLLLIACITLGFRLMAEMKARDREIKSEINVIRKREEGRAFTDSLRRIRADKRLDSLAVTVKDAINSSDVAIRKSQQNTRKYEELDRRLRDIVIHMPEF